ncbi:MAG: hypothetical protein GEV08_17750 [Acidimicrobiia bacterium]|nr:hypothetical protein [Acidimicrobiia bacterium]
MAATDRSQLCGCVANATGARARPRLSPSWGASRPGPCTPVGDVSSEPPAMVEPSVMRGRRRSWLAVSTLLAAALAAGCTGGRVGPVVYSGQPRPEPPPADIIDVLEQDEDGRFTTLLSLLTAEDPEEASEAEVQANAAVRDANAEVVDALTGTGPVTLFAPTNDAFDALGRTPAQLKSDPEGLASLLALHVVDRDVSFAEPPYVIDGLVDGRTEPEKAGLVIVSDVSLVTSLAGVDLLLSGASEQVTVRDDTRTVQVGEADIQAPNGFIQVLDGVLAAPAPLAP